MFVLNFEKINSLVVKRVEPFLNEVLKNYPENIHSIYLIGSAVTADFDDNRSDINTIFVLREMDFEFVERLAPVGKKYGRKKIAVPLIMTREYIGSSLDVFPIEFLDIQLIHEVIYGEDIFKEIFIDKNDLRLQCERELKSRLIGLTRNFLISHGECDLLRERLSIVLTGTFPLLRSICFLFSQEPRIKKDEVISAFCSVVGMEEDVFKDILALKKGELKLNKDEIYSLFEKFYQGLEKIVRITDEIKV